MLKPTNRIMQGKTGAALPQNLWVRLGCAAHPRSPESVAFPSLASTSDKSVNKASKHDERMASMTFASVYPHYLAKVEKKGRSKQELHQVIEWLTGYDERMLQTHIEGKTTFEQFFRDASLNPNACLITGVICGYRVEEIENPLTQQVRYLDKLVDELARGRKLEKILRTG